MKTKKPINKLLFFILSFTWGLLWTIIGGIIYLVTSFTMNSSYVTSGKRNGVRYKTFKGLPGSISLGVFVILDDSMNNEEILKHELGHTIQNIIFGPLFVFLVAIPSGIRAALWWRIQKRHYKKFGTYKDYEGIWFESQATRLGNKYF